MVRRKAKMEFTYICGSIVHHITYYGKVSVQMISSISIKIHRNNLKKFQRPVDSLLQHGSNQVQLHNTNINILLFSYIFIGWVMVHLKLYILNFISSCMNLYYQSQDEVMVMTSFIKGLEVEQPQFTGFYFFLSRIKLFP